MTVFDGNVVRVSPVPHLSVVNNGDSVREHAVAFSDVDIDRMRYTLAQFSENDLMAPTWTLNLANSRRQQNVRFPVMYRDTDSILLRALALQRFSYAASSVQRSVDQGSWLIDFFTQRHLHIENCRTSSVGLIVSALDSDKSLSVMQKNSIMTTLGAMVELCEGYGLAAGIGIVDCSYRWKEKRLPKRAPDAVTVQQLDSYFFDRAIEIPLQYRTLYILLRLISNRVSEVLFMDINCVTYPDEDTYSISIPTQKETPYHIPEYSLYHKKLSGIEENYLHQCLCELKKYASGKQVSLKPQYRDYLFVSPTGKTLVTASDFNSFLADLCLKYKIVDSQGNPAKITSHDLRHTAVVERFRYGIISPYQTMRESNHSSITQTLGYSYASEHDEYETVEDVSKHMLERQFSVQEPAAEPATPREMAPKKFLALRDDPNVRLLLDDSVCVNRACVPSIDICSDCEFFLVNPFYADQIQEAIARLTCRKEMLLSCKGNPDTIEFVQRQLDVYKRMQEKMVAKDKMLEVS